MNDKEFRDAAEIEARTPITINGFLSSGAVAISAERLRQIESEGWTADHDDMWQNGELLEAAAVYLDVNQGNVLRILENPSKYGWPWAVEWFKPFGQPPADDPRFERSFPTVDRIRCLEKAGALIAAEIDRLKRLEN